MIRSLNISGFSFPYLVRRHYTTLVLYTVIWSQGKRKPLVGPQLAHLQTKIIRPSETDWQRWFSLRTVSTTLYCKLEAQLWAIARSRVCFLVFMITCISLLSFDWWESFRQNTHVSSLNKRLRMCICRTKNQNTIRSLFRVLAQICICQITTINNYMKQPLWDYNHKP